MFSDSERNELVSILVAILEEEKAGKAATRDELAAKLVDSSREYLAGRYNTAKKDTGGFGVHKGTDILNPDDFA